MKILVTGGAEFIGSHYMRTIRRESPADVAR
jgi:dTDP-D-glucose 4,6-dehydratase